MHLTPVSLKNLNTGQCMATHMILCDRFWRRAKGLLGGPRLGKQDACWITPCNSIHSFGLRYALDLYFLDKNQRIVRVIRHFRPNRISPLVWNAHSVLEFSASEDRVGSPGDVLDLEMPDRTRRNGRRLGRSGQAAIEFGLITLVSFALMLAIFDIMRVCYSWAAIQYAVNEAARAGIINGQMPTVTAQFNAIARQVGVPGATLALYDLNATAIAAGAQLPPSSFFCLEARAKVPLNILALLRQKWISQKNMEVVAKTIIRNEPYA